MKIAFMILGFLFLGLALWMLTEVEGGEDWEPGLRGSVDWTCEPPDERTGDVDCRTSGGRLLGLELRGAIYAPTFALVGVGFLVAAAAVGARGPQRQQATPGAAPSPPAGQMPPPPQRPPPAAPGQQHPGPPGPPPFR